MKGFFLKKSVVGVVLIAASGVALAGDINLSSAVVDGRVIVTLKNTPENGQVFVDRVENTVFLKDQGKSRVATELRTVSVGRALVDSVSFDVGSAEQVFDGGGTQKEAAMRTGFVAEAEQIEGFCRQRWTPVTVYLTTAGGSQVITSLAQTFFCRSDDEVK